MEIVVTSARVVCLSRPAVAAIPPVVDLIASFLAPPTSWTPERAIQRGCTHLARHLLDQLEADPSLHHLVKRSRARGFLPIAAGVGDISLLEHLVTRFGCCVDASALSLAATSGQLEALQWLYGRALASLRLAPGETVDAFNKDALTDRLLVLVGEAGHLETLQWMLSVRGNVAVVDVVRGAIRKGHLHVVEWLFPMLETPIPEFNDLADTAVFSGNADMVKFLHSKGVLPLTSSNMDTMAHFHGQKMELLQWMYDNGGEGCTDRAADFAAIYGDLDLLKYLFSKGLGWTTRAVYGAAGNGHLDVLKFLHAQKRFDGFLDAAFTHAVGNCHVDVAQYLFDHRSGDFAVVSLDSMTTRGGVEMLKWLQINCPDAECSVVAMTQAAANGNLAVVQFLHENRTEGCTTEAMDGAACNGHLDVIEWLHLHRTEGCTSRAMDIAAMEGHLDVVKWLHLHRTEGCTTDAMDNTHDLAILQWLSKNRSEGFTGRAISDASIRGDLEALLWLHEHSPADMWTPDLATKCADFGRVEALEWFAETFPTFVDASELLASCNQSKWWASSWLKQRVGA